VAGFTDTDRYHKAERMDIPLGCVIRACGWPLGILIAFLDYDEVYFPDRWKNAVPLT